MKEYGSLDKQTILVFEEFDEDEEITFDGDSFINCDIKCKGSYIEFRDCIFKGNIKIHNDGIGGIDQVAIYNSKMDNSNLKIVSPLVLSVDIDIEEGNSITIECLEVELLRTRINSNSKIKYHNELIIEDSHIQNTNIVCEHNDISKVNLVIKNSVVNGVDNRTSFKETLDEEKNK